MDSPRLDAPTLPATRAWTVALGATIIYVGWLVGWYWDTVASMVAIWYRSDTFAHGFVVFPITGWLVWRKRHELALLTPSPALSTLPLAAMVLAGVLWLLGDLGDVLAARHFAWITLLIAGIWLLVGDTIARRLMFPLAFLYFAVPVGEFLIPTLIEWTANFTISALRATGVPVLRDGMTFRIPSGSWSVVEACSGLRYLIASLTVGVLFAYLAYRSPMRRAAFVAASIIVPIIANWLRAYMIVMIGHLSANRLAVGIDHIIYGWIFFGLVMLLLFWIGSLWRQDEDGETTDARGLVAALPASPITADASRWTAVLAVALVVAAIVPASAWILQGPRVHGVVDTRALQLGEWRPIDVPLIDWVPEFTAPRAVIASTYERGADHAALYVALYYDQDSDSKLVSTGNQLIHSTTRIGYKASERERTIEIGSTSLEVVESVLQVRYQRILARSWFWIDGEVTASPIRAKFMQAQARLRGHGDAGAIIVVYALVPPDGEPSSVALDELTREAATTLPAIIGKRLQAEPAR